MPELAVCYVVQGFVHLFVTGQDDVGLLGQDRPAAVFAADAFAGETALVRSRRDGDTIRYFGITHKAKRVIADAKLTPPEKARLFFLAAGDTVLYIRALATADAAFYRGGDAMRLYIKSEENKGDAAGV